MKRFLMILMSIAIIIGSVSLSSCDGTPTPTPTIPDQPAANSPADGNGEEPTEEEQGGGSPIAVGTVFPISVEWHIGYVASSSHSSTPNAIVDGGDNYSYSDVFTIPYAGTTITFVDNNSNSNGDTGFASGNAYVFSRWRKMDGKWILDMGEANYDGANTAIKKTALSTTTYTYTTTVDNECLRISFRSGQTSKFTPASFPSIKAVYTGAKGTAADFVNVSKWLENQKSAQYFSELEGLTINAIGDSYFQGAGLPAEYIWLGMLANKYNINMNNYGISGSTMSTYGNSNPIVNRYMNMPNNNPDIVILEGGRNDYNKDTPMGTLTSTDKATYMGALNVTIDGLQAKYPNAIIICITNWNYNNSTLHDNPYGGSAEYAAAMKAVADAQGVYCIMANDPSVSGVDVSVASFRAQYCLKPGDVSHLNVEGMKLVMPKFEAIIAAYYKDFLKK